MTRVLAAFDKFRGTATAADLGMAAARAAAGLGVSIETVAMADGGEGLLEVFGAPNRTAAVVDALGQPVQARWWSGPDGLAVVETARSNGLQLIGGARANDPVDASTRGVGELLAAALAERPRRLIVGVGGSATTDGGTGAIEVLTRRRLLRAFAETDVVVACDVTTAYLSAAEVFGPQKGASADQVVALTARLNFARADLMNRFGMDPETVVGGGAAGGLAGGLAVLGARLVPGVALVADHVGLDAAIGRADLVITGEGMVDRTSLQGKVVGAVTSRARAAGCPVLVVCGSRQGGVEVPGAVTVALTDRVGVRAAFEDTLASVEAVVRDHLLLTTSGNHRGGTRMPK